MVTARFVDCSEFLYDSCVRPHQRVQLTKDHVHLTRTSAGLVCTSYIFIELESGNQRLLF